VYYYNTAALVTPQFIIITPSNQYEEFIVLSNTSKLILTVLSLKNKLVTTPSTVLQEKFIDKAITQLTDKSKLLNSDRPRHASPWKDGVSFNHKAEYQKTFIM